MTHIIEHKITGVKLAEDGSKLEVFTRYPSNTFVGIQLAPDRIFKDVYIIQDNKIVLSETIEGSIKPSVVIPEEITFPK